MYDICNKTEGFVILYFFEVLVSHDDVTMISFRWFSCTTSNPKGILCLSPAVFTAYALPVNFRPFPKIPRGLESEFHLDIFTLDV